MTQETFHGYVVSGYTAEGLAILVPNEEDRIMLQELEKARLHILELKRLGKGPSVNPIIRGEYMYYKHDDEAGSVSYTVLGPNGVHKVFTKIPESNPAKMIFSYPVVCDLYTLYPLIMDYIKDNPL